MGKKLLHGALLGLGILSASVNAAEKTQSNLVIKQLTQTDGGVMIGFTSLPTDCTGSWLGSHALLGSGLKDFDSLYALVSVAEITGDAVTITYVDNGDCSSKIQLLGISNIN